MGLSSLRFTEEAGSAGTLSHSIAHPLVPLASKLIKGEWLQHKAKKALSCSASPGHGKTGRERRETPFPMNPGMAWANLALVPNVFPLTAPGTNLLICPALSLSH